MQSRRRVGGGLPLSPKARSYPAIAVRMEDCPNPRIRRMGDTAFEDAGGEFILKKKRRLETGTLVGVWVEVENGRAWFQHQEIFVEKKYKARAQ